MGNRQAEFRAEVVINRHPKKILADEDRRFE